jgi:two-component system OmpR family sensor kinase/two-component system sensor histidine kinase BaeS
LSDAARQSRGRFNVRFFWQLIFAFSLVTVLVWGGMFLAGRHALSRLEAAMRDRAASMATVWSGQLAEYYRSHGGWQGIGSALTDSPQEFGWIALDGGWPMTYALASSDGIVVAASDSSRVGQALDSTDRIAAASISVEGEDVGLLVVSEFDPVGSGRLPSVGRAALRTFLFTGLTIAGGSLIVGLVISRGMSRPIVELTEASRAVAEGDLSARVPERYQGEVGELARAFNTMTEELARADQIRRNLTADVAHELRTPLSVIRGKLEGVLDGVYPATPEHLEPIVDETKLLAHLVEDLRLLTQAETGQLTLEKRPTDIGDLLQDAYVNFSPQASDRGVTLSLDVPAGLPRAIGDWRRIAQVLSNLVTNALRHTPQGGCVTLSAAAEGAYLTVTVTDTGAGIHPQDLPYIFERFWRGEKSRSRSGGGTGLGLAIARQLVEMQGGTIGVASEAGQGSRFWFSLPVEQPD